MLQLLIGLCLAAPGEPTPPALPAPEAATPPAPAAQVSPTQDPAPIEEITVWGTAQVRQARARLVRRLEGLGYSVTRDRGSLTVLRPPSRWMGRVRLHDDGWIDFGRPVVALQRVQSYGNESALAYTPEQGTLQRAQEVAGSNFRWWVLPSSTKLAGVHQRVLEATAAERQDLQRVLAETVFQEQLAALPAQLDRLWAEGVPLQPGARLPDASARRRAALAYWSSRTDTREGLAVSELIETWLREVVQPSATPVSPAERAQAEAAREDRRSLKLE